jgi:hypothetical protein
MARVASLSIVAGLTMLALLVLTPASALGSGGGSGGGAKGTAGFADQFAVGPAERGTGLSYFNFTVPEGGGSVAGAMSVTGEDHSVIRLAVARADGDTADDSGDAYSVAPKGGCAEVACWIRGLPVTLDLAYKQVTIVSFTVVIPRGTSPGQYLAGVSVEPAARPKVPRGGHGAISLLVHRIVIGVAVTVGSGYPHSLSIPDVTGTRIGNNPGLIVEEKDTGRAFEHPFGAVTLRTPSGRSLKFNVRSGTVLPGNGAGLGVHAPGVQPGTYPASAYLYYDLGHKIARWSGEVVIPGAKKVIVVPPGSKVLVVSGGIPAWAIWALALLSALLLGGGLWALLAWRRRKKKDEGPSPVDLPPAGALS